jgi:hypothetical protein
VKNAKWPNGVLKIYAECDEVKGWHCKGPPAPDGLRRGAAIKGIENAKTQRGVWPQPKGTANGRQWTRIRGIRCCPSPLIRVHSCQFAVLKIYAECNEFEGLHCTNFPRLCSENRVR